MATQIENPGSVVIAVASLTTAYLLITAGGVLCDGTLANKPCPYRATFCGFCSKHTPSAAVLKLARK